MRTEFQNQATDLMRGIHGTSVSDETQMGVLRVTDMDGKAIPQAQILIGQGLNEPFVSNFIESDENGVFAAPGAWTSPQTVTVSAPGYLRVSYLAQMPTGQTFRLRKAAKEKKYELKGQATGFKVIDKDDKVDFALLVPVLKKNDLFAFDMTKVISSQMDEISVYGQKIQMPSNVSLPRQKENYGIIPVTMEKPVFRIYFEEMGPQKVIAVRGQFPFSKVTKEMENKKPFNELINYLSIQGGSLKTAQITGATQNMDIPVNELIFNVTKNYKAPVYSNDQTLIVLPLAVYNGEYFPTDIKSVPSNTAQNLMTAAGTEPLVVTVITSKPDSNNKMDGRLSVNIKKFDNSEAPEMLALMENPQVLSLGEVKIKPLSQPSFIQAAATYSMLSVVETINMGGNKIDITKHVWEVYGEGWMDQFRLPTWPNDSVLKGKKRWEVSLVGSPDKAIDLGPAMLENATHATHVQTDF
jgi:hypothetical protein